MVDGSRRSRWRRRRRMRDILICVRIATPGEISRRWVIARTILSVFVRWKIGGSGAVPGFFSEGVGTGRSTYSRSSSWIEVDAFGVVSTRKLNLFSIDIFYSLSSNSSVFKRTLEENIIWCHMCDARNYLLRKFKVVSQMFLLFYEYKEYRS